MSQNITHNRCWKHRTASRTGRAARHRLIQALDLRGTVLVTPYTTGIEPPQRDPGPAVSTNHDRRGSVSAQPDPFNQIVPSDLGWLLAGIYQCAQDGTGLLIERFPNAFTAQECRQMLRAMDANEIGVFLEAGVPPGTTVIHKHGWINDTHGDAGL